MKLRFEQKLLAPPELAWRYLTWPELMNLWSEAKVETVASSGGDQPDAAGATRRVTVTVLGRRFPLMEEVVESVRPCRFVYRVTEGGGLSGHRGVMTLEADPEGTRLVWEVTYHSRMPGVGLLMKWVVGSAVRRSLGRLARILKDASPAPD